MASSDAGRDVLDMAGEPAHVPGEQEPRGLLIEGEFLGLKDPAPYTLRDGSTGVSRPKIGLKDADGDVYAITVSPDTFVEWKHRPRGEVIQVRVTVRGYEGRVQYRLRGDVLNEPAGWD